MYVLHFKHTAFIFQLHSNSRSRTCSSVKYSVLSFPQETEQLHRIAFLFLGRANENILPQMRIESTNISLAPHASPHII